MNEVNAPAIARERGIELVETRRSQARDFNEIVRVTVVCGDRRERVVGTTIGQRKRPHLLAAWGQNFNIQLEDYLVLFQYSNVPGMIGRVGAAFGEHGINISAASVGYGRDEGEAVMALTTESAVPHEVIDEIVSTDGFIAGRSVSVVA